MPATAPAPSFPASALHEDELREAHELNMADRTQWLAGQSEDGNLADDAKSHVIRTYRYSKSGERILDTETWVPILDIPTTPEALLRKMQAVPRRAGSEKVKMEIGVQFADAAQAFITVYLNRYIDSRGFMRGNPPAVVMSALFARRDVQQAWNAVDDARAALARGHISISKVRNLEQDEVNANGRYVAATMAALDAITETDPFTIALRSLADSLAHRL